MEKVVIVGSGSHAKIIVDILKRNAEFRIVGFTEQKDVSLGKDIDGIPILGSDRGLNDLFNSGVKNAIVGKGGFRSNKSRERIFKKVRKIGFRMINAIHPSSIIGPNVSIGEGVVIYAGVIINVGAKIGNNVIIATGASVDHETTIEDHCLISAGVNIGGNVSIGEGTLVAIGATVVSHLKICKNVLIGAGAVVAKDITESGLYMGVPVKQIKTMKRKES